MALVLIGSFFLLLLCNVPVAVSMGLSAVFGMLSGGFGLKSVATVFYSAIAKYTMLAIPFFILAGIIMDYAGISKRLIRFADACCGHRKGGLAIVSIVTACFFAAISGSGPATVAALAGILIPAMVKHGYNKNFATAVIASAGGIGMIIPPSIPFVIYAMLAEVSVGTMFIAGIVPGILFGVAYGIASLFCLKKDPNVVSESKAGGKERWEAFKDAFWGLLSPVIILGGIYGGFFTPTEASGVAVVYGLFVGLFIYKEIKWSEIGKIFVEACASSAVIMFIMGAAGAFTWILTTSGLAGQMSEVLLSISGNRNVILLVITIIFLIAGCFVDSASGFYLLMPILLPVVKDIGLNLYAFGVLATANFAIGQITPPVGSNLFVACNVAKISMKDLCSKIGPFIIAGVVCLLIMTYFPQIITFLPSLMGMNIG
ncbi:MAG: TRAP transporter large permease [Lachnospiraceae bacterium]|nr:TRAP transporter large permease [Lachnospiraceae bacterium]